MTAISATGWKLPGPGVFVLALAGGLIGLALIDGIFISPSFMMDMAKPGNARGLINSLFAFATIAIVIITVIANFWVKVEEVEERGTLAKEITAILNGTMGTILGVRAAALGSAAMELRARPASASRPVQQ